MAGTDVNARWQAEMAPYFAELEGRPDEGFTLLEEVFHLEDQLAALTPASAGSGAPTEEV